MQKETREILLKKLPAEAVKPHPSKTYLSTIKPMYVIDVLNEAFGMGEWKMEVYPINFVGKFAVAKVIFTVEKENIHLEQFGGSDNADVGDAYKGAATDALTKIASYLGVGASVYKGQGNVDSSDVNIAPMSIEEACGKLSESTSVEQLETVFKTFTSALKADNEVIAKAKEVKQTILEA